MSINNSKKNKEAIQIEQTPEQIKANMLRNHFAAIKKMNTTQLNNALRVVPSVLSKFDYTKVASYLQNPAKHEKELRNLSNYLYNVSSQYRQIVRHFATMPTYDYTLNISEIPNKINADKITKSYQKTAQYVDKLNLKHEMSKALKVAFKEDTFFGYEYESKDSYFIKKLDGNHCRISSIEDGIFNFAFDFSYFETFTDQLDLFPDEFQAKFIIYKLDRTNNRWQELDADKTVCFKVNEDIIEYSVPPFNTVFESIFDLDEYKKIKKAKTKMDNFLLLAQKIPMADDKNSDVDVFKISLDLAMEFHNMLSESLPLGVGAVTSPMEIESLKMEKSKSDSDTISQAQREVYTDSGISQYLFNSDKNTSAGITKSITSDEQIIFDVLNQIERWVNRKLKKQTGNMKFYIRFIQNTQFNRDEVFSRYLKAAQASAPVKTEMMASLGITPSEMLNKTILENEIFKLHEKFIPLVSSHTQSGDEASGRPQVSEDEQSDSTQVNRDNEDS